jgi:sugar lactone lactonase YvrE
MTQLKSTRNTQYSFRSLLFAGAMLIAFSLAGCGSGSGGDSASSTQSPPSPPPPVAFVPSITLFAGALGGAGNSDGLTGRLNSPFSVAVDASSNIYIGDGGNCNIRKLSASGLSVLLGGRSCYVYAVDGTASFSTFSRSQFSYYPTPAKVIADRLGRLYLVEAQVLVGAQTAIATISRMEPAGKLTALPFTVDATAQFAVDTDGNVFEANANQGVINKYDKNGSRTVFASGLRTPLDFSPFQTLAIALGGDGSLYVADHVTHFISKISAAGQVTTLAGTGFMGSTDGIGTSAQFSYPSGIAVDNVGNVYVADTGNFTIRKITPNGMVSTLAGMAGMKGSIDGLGPAARFQSVGDVAIDGSGALIVADMANNAIRRISPDGVVTTIAGVLPKRGSGDGAALTSQFNSPSGIARDTAGNTYLTDTGNYTIRKLSSGGDVSTFAGKAGTYGAQDGLGTAATFTSPKSISLDPQGSIYVADLSLIRKVSSAGEVKFFADAGAVRRPGGARGAPTFSISRDIQSMAFDNRSQLYAVDSVDANVTKVSSTGTFAAIDCGANCVPQSIASDTVSNLFVASKGTIRRISADGVAAIVAGSVPNSTFPLGGWKDGTGADALFSDNMRSLAVDNSGNIFVCDTGNHVIRKITPSGAVTTIAGKAGIAGTTLGPLPGLLNAPKGIVIDNAGNLYVTTEDAVVKITLS